MSSTVIYNRIKLQDSQGLKCNTLDDFNWWQSGPRIIPRSEVWVENCMVMVIPELSTKCPPFEVHGMDHQQWCGNTVFLKTEFLYFMVQIKIEESPKALIGTYL